MWKLLQVSGTVMYIGIIAFLLLSLYLVAMIATGKWVVILSLALVWLLYIAVKFLCYLWR